MRHASRWIALAWILIASAVASAQEPFRRDLEVDPAPTVLKPPRPSLDQRQHTKALKLFARGLLMQKDHRLVEALTAFHDVLVIEPKAVAVYKVMADVCFQLDRDNEALDYCRKALELDPNDYNLWYRYGHEMKDRGKLDEAANAVDKALLVPEVQEQSGLRAQMLFDLGTLREQLHQYAAAAEAFERVAEILDNSEDLLAEIANVPRQKIDEEAAKTYERLGHVELQAKHYDEAVTAFEKAQKKDPAHTARLHFNLAEVYLARKQPEKALDHVRHYLDTQPGGAEAYERLIEVLKQLHQEKEIVPALEKAAARDPFNQGLKLLLAQQYVQANDSAKAEKAFLSIMEDYASEDAYRGLAKLYQQQNRWDDLLQRLDQDLGDPRNMGSGKTQAQVLATDTGLTLGVANAARARPQGGQTLSYQTRRALATLCRQAEAYDLAEHFCRFCLADDPQPGDAYVEMCRILSEAERPEAEAAICREALTKQLKVPAIVFQLELARSLAVAGKDREALAAAEEAVKKTEADTPERFQAEHNLVIVSYRCNQLAKAATAASKLIDQTTDPLQQRQLRRLLAGIYSAQHESAKSEEQLEKLLATDKEDAGACNDLGYQWADQGKNLEKAEELIRKAIDLERIAWKAKHPGATDAAAADGDNAAYIDSLGWVLFKRGHAPEALKELERAAKLKGGDDPVIWEHLGDVYMSQGQQDQAKTAWQKALELYDKSKRVGLDDHRQEVHDKLQRLK